MDNFLEEGISRKNSAFSTILYAIMWIILLSSAIMAAFYLSFVFQFNSSTILPSLGLFVIFGGIAYLSYRFKDNLRVEYDCSITNGLIEIGVIYNNNRRRDVITFKMKDVQALAHGDDQKIAAYAQRPDIKQIRVTRNPDVPNYLVYLTQGEKKYLIRMEVSKDFAALMKMYVSRTADVRI